MKGTTEFSKALQTAVTEWVKDFIEYRNYDNFKGSYVFKVWEAKRERAEASYKTVCDAWFGHFGTMNGSGARLATFTDKTKKAALANKGLPF